MGTSEEHRWVYPVRVGSLVHTYANIAEQAFGDFLDEDAPCQLDQYERRRANAIKTVVFSVMAIEAAAFEFIVTTQDEQVATELDRLSIEAKWIAATDRPGWQSLAKNGPALNCLRSLVKARNSLVHQKSKPGDQTGKAMDDMRIEWARFEKDQVPNAFKTLVLLSLELDALPSAFVGIVPYRDRRLLIPPGFRNDYSPHPRVKKVIDRCHQIHKKHLKGV
ncbi:hypothetical protein G9Q84_28810 [Pseudomonas sp. P7]|uniref:hypothetical protein n=1 Tax=Pseudomonas sivasensis TaxID=1880678 RepID=UPI0015EC2595|nr:hypothetical protein [Pseudomonas sivasensis]MBA2926879.1 hypothetical protein [Pseudomonas sivasensis]